MDERTELALREAAPRVLGALLRRGADFSSSEEAVQEALLAGLVEWRERGMPSNPGGWLYRVAQRRLADRAQDERSRRVRESAVAAERPEAIEAVDEFPVDESVRGDDALRLLFTCCHPSLTPPSAIALTLRAVAGLTTAEIARAFLVPEATMAQRIARAKRAVAESALPFSMPIEAERPKRLASVMQVLYLVFDEGYATSGGKELGRIELAREAIRLARELHRSAPDEPEVAGLLALMLFTEARRAARTGPSGELVPLDEQDRGRWDPAAIDEGNALVAAAFARGRIGSYQVQAAIAALHDEAPSHDATDWPQILALYELLRRMARNPMVELNHAIAAAMVHGPAHGLALLDALEDEPALARSHRLDAVRAHLLERSGERDAAIARYRAAALRATNLRERQYLFAKAARLEAR